VNDAVAEPRRPLRDPAVRDAVRTIMATHSMLDGPLTAKMINLQLPEQMRRSDQDIRHHMRVIWAEGAD
jgi:hypothetical protein